MCGSGIKKNENHTHNNVFFLYHLVLEVFFELLLMLFLFLLFVLATKNLTENVLVVVGTLDGTIYALNEKTGEVLWSRSTGDPLIKSSSISHIFPSLDGSLFHITSNGLVEVYISLFILYFIIYCYFFKRNFHGKLQILLS